VTRPLSRHEVQRDAQMVRALELIADRLGRIAVALERIADPDKTEKKEGD
jgi:hypothetical protein